jgi:hypothetical protein
MRVTRLDYCDGCGLCTTVVDGLCEECDDDPDDYDPDDDDEDPPP